MKNTQKYLEAKKRKEKLEKKPHIYALRERFKRLTNGRGFEKVQLTNCTG